jgi:hypothetical protein
MRPCTNGDETDAFDSGRTKLKWNHGDRKKIKRRANRRERHSTRQALRSGREA